MARRRSSARTRWFWGIGAAAAVAVAVTLGLVFQPWLLFIDVRVDDDIPAAASTTAAAAPPATAAPSTPAPAMEPVDAVVPEPPAGPIDLLSGSLISHEHTTSGAVRVIENPDGSRQLALVGLETSNGPDVHVWLSAGPVVEGTDGWFTAGQYDHIDLGPIKGNLGDQLYDIPADVDLSVFRTVDLWCVQFGVSFGAAALA